MIWFLMVAYPVSALVGSLVWLALFIAVLHRAGQLKLSVLTRVGLGVLMVPVAGIIFMTACAINESSVLAPFFFMAFLMVVYPPLLVLFLLFWGSMLFATLRYAKKKKADLFLCGIFAALTGPVALIFLILDGYDWMFPPSRNKGQGI